MRRPLFEVTRELTAVCMGRVPADLVIRNGRLVNVHTREVLDGTDVAITHGRVAMFGDVSHTVGPDTETIDAEGAYLVPGLIDTHLHVESVMVTVTRFAEAVLPHGTSTHATRRRTARTRWPSCAPGCGCNSARGRRSAISPRWRPC